VVHKIRSITLDNNFKITNLDSIVILGITSDIGFWLCKIILKINPNCKIFGNVRVNSENQKVNELKSINQVTLLEHDIFSEDSWEKFINEISKNTQNIDFFINTVGFLQNETFLPEKSIRGISFDGLMESFKVNTLSGALSAKYLIPMFDKKKKTCFIQLSAKVGSISENSLGGWYGYRSSKAALNMFMKTLSIELNRKRLDCCTMCIHPGTTNTRLSKPFIKTVKHKVWEPQESAMNIINVIEKNWNKEACNFYNWDNSIINW
jgi:NAD(P)-dependent dehydrogenase (short-subunit alcohol dehydrogenase family)